MKLKEQKRAREKKRRNLIIIIIIIYFTYKAQISIGLFSFALT